MTDAATRQPATLHLLNQYAGEFGPSAGAFALTDDANAGHGTILQLAASA